MMSPKVQNDVVLAIEDDLGHRPPDRVSDVGEPALGLCSSKRLPVASVISETWR